MGLDIRIPIGAMFSILGLLLIGFGLYAASATPEVFKKSLDINVNLWWGLVMLAFGIAMFYFGRRADRRGPGDKTTSPPSAPRH
jgi:hypothetical protein